MLRFVPAKRTFLVALCRRNAHFLDPCITACSSSYTSYQESGTTAQTVNVADMPIAWLDPGTWDDGRRPNPDMPATRWRYTKEYAFGAITPTPNLPHSKTCTHIFTGVCCIFWHRPRPFASIIFFRKIAKTAKLFFRYSSHISRPINTKLCTRHLQTHTKRNRIQFFDPTVDDETVAFWILVY